jgi:hypothetical protein
VSISDSRYTAAVTGIHKLRFRTTHVAIADNAVNYPLPVNVDVILEVYDAGNTLQSTHSQSFQYTTTNEDFELIYDVPMNDTDYCIVKVNSSSYRTGTARVPIAEVSFDLANTPTFSGLVQTASIDLNAPKRITIETNLSYTDYSQIKNGQKKLITIMHRNNKYTGYLYESKYDEVKGVIELTLQAKTL